MSYITRNANILLLFLIVLSSTTLVGATVYFQENFNSINTEYNKKLEQLSQVSKDLAVQQELLRRLKEELTLKAAREEEFTEQYTEVRETKEKLAEEKEVLTGTKKKLEQELQTTEQQLESAQEDLRSKESEINNLNNEVTDLKSDVSALQRAVNRKESELASCTTRLAGCTGCPS